MWRFTKSQIADFVHYRQQQLPDGYTQNEEMNIINHYCCSLLATLFKNEKNSQLTLISYAAVLFKRYYMIKTIFEQSGMHQMLLCCSYLGMKLNGLSQQSIAIQAQQLKRKPKHERFHHYGDEFYAKYEILIVQALGYDIDVKPIYPIIQSAIFIYQIKDLLEQSLFIRYEKKIEEYFLKSLQGFTIFTYKESEIAFAIVECSLQSIFQEILSPHISLSLGGIKPLKQLTFEKIKKYCQENKQNGTLIIEQIDQRDISIANHCQQIQEVVHLLQEIKDTSKEFEKNYERYKQQRQAVFSLPMSVEFLDVKKQVAYN
ncbi:unnamed protein product (macronuclear) [Paramecium tetraurelia]|uniref:Cyclin N-terminal domain-containing protein n=1 Tax=Paramecium tetraurelia TaxID=5888 RepID=A0DSQ9_PARTE|nr:uncharacterized protein GSPATT00019769001 [Paramecium tetraurelia]CAK86076.1 unnamed protein product [Paramecium tetraurelia]|eukprot:XP_001453473.1 hypothetical protein (macronuclear) [Paramecium tetraurelia strain d4-2]